MDISKLTRLRVQGDDIVEKAQVGYVNLSSIISKLINLAARMCEHYASDVVYDINSVTTYANSHETIRGFKRFVFGFRRSGVDGSYFVEQREAIDYRCLWVLDITKDAGYLELRFWEAELRVCVGNDAKKHPGWKLSRACIQDTLMAKRGGAFRNNAAPRALLQATLISLRQTRLKPHNESFMIEGRFRVLYEKKMRKD